MREETPGKTAIAEIVLFDSEAYLFTERNQGRQWSITTEEKTETVFNTPLSSKYLV